MVLILALALASPPPLQPLYPLCVAPSLRGVACSGAPGTLHAGDKLVQAAAADAARRAALLAVQVHRRHTRGAQPPTHTRACRCRPACVGRAVWCAVHICVAYVASRVGCPLTRRRSDRHERGQPHTAHYVWRSPGVVRMRKRIFESHQRICYGSRASLCPGPHVALVQSGSGDSPDPAPRPALRLRRRCGARRGCRPHVLTRPDTTAKQRRCAGRQARAGLTAGSRHCGGWACRGPARMILWR